MFNEYAVIHLFSFWILIVVRKVWIFSDTELTGCKVLKKIAREEKTLQSFYTEFASKFVPCMKI